MNLLNLIMELSLVYLSLFTLIGEAADLSYESNEILGLVTIIFMLLGQLLMLVCVFLEILRLIVKGVIGCCCKRRAKVESKDSSVVVERVDSDATNKSIITNKP